MTNSEPSKLDQITENLNKLTDLLTQTTIRTIHNEQVVNEHDNLINGLILAAQQNASAAQQNNESIKRLESTITILAEKFDRTIERIDLMQSEIRGLQTQNRRILDRLLGEETDENNN